MNRTGMAQKWGFLAIFSASGALLTGCGSCKMSGSTDLVTLSAQNGVCVVNSSITCTCSGGGFASTCSNASQTFNQGDAAPNFFPPCPATFSCDNVSGCS